VKEERIAGRDEKEGVEVPPPMIGGIPWTPSQIRAIDRGRGSAGIGMAGWVRRLLGRNSAQGDEDRPDDQGEEAKKAHRS
jgi:hypothetical protein